MIKRVITLLMVVGTILTTFATNNISLSTSSGEPGEDINIDVGFENDDEAVVVDLLIPLVEKQLTYVDGSCTLNGERINGHQVQAAETDEGLRIVVYSISLNPFVGNCGRLLSFKLKLGKDPQRYPLDCTAIVGDANGNSLETTTSGGAVTILASELTILTPEINFGHIPIRSNYSATVRVKNTGTTDLDLTDYLFSASEFTTETTSFTLHPDQTQSIKINYLPITRGAISETMQIVSNAVNGTQKVSLVADPFSVNELHVSKVSGISDEEVTVSLTMNNMESIVGMQCTFVLPKELVYVENSFATTDRSAGLTPTASLKGNELTLFLYSINNAEIAGDDGEIATFKLRLNGRSGYYYLYPRNVILSNASVENMLSATSNGYVYIQSPKLSCSSELDMGSSPIITPAEAKFTLTNSSNIPLTIEKVVFLSEGYSVEDSFPIVIQGRQTHELTVKYIPQSRGEHSATMNIYTNDPDNRMKPIAIRGVIYEPNNLNISNISDAEGCDIIFSLDNYTDIVAMQMDINWLPSMTTDAAKLRLSDRMAGLSATISDFGGGVYRVIIYSLNNTSVSGNSGEIFRLKYIGSDFVNTEMTVSNIVISNSKSENMASQTEVIYRVPPILAESITLDKAEIRLKATETAELTATVLPEYATDKTVVWSSSDGAVAIVDETGLVTAIGVGDATITATTADGTNLSATCRIIVEPTPGDANNDAKINVSDVITTASYILGEEVEEFIFLAADITADGRVRVTDIVGIVEIILFGDNGSALRRMSHSVSSSNYIYLNDFTISPDETKKLRVHLAGSVDYTAFQMDIKLPKGLVLTDCRLVSNETDHTLEYVETEELTTRILSYSLSKKKVPTENGAFLELELTAHDDFNGGEIIFEEIVFTKVDLTEEEFDNLSKYASVNSDIISTDSETESVYTENSNIIIHSGSDNIAIITQTNGVSEIVGLTRGKNIISNKERGIYIIKLKDKTYKLILK